MVEVELLSEENGASGTKKMKHLGNTLLYVFNWELDALEVTTTMWRAYEQKTTGANNNSWLLEITILI